MKMSAQGRRLLIQREGVRLHSYRDTVGVWTIGVGHTAMAGPPIPGPGVSITTDQCDAILARDLVQYEQAIERALKVPVEPHEFDALVSICFNVGARFANSVVMRRLNAGDREGAAEAIMMWNKPKEILGRRRGEQIQFLTPYRTMPIDVVPAKPKPKPKSKTPEAAAGAVVAAGGAVSATKAGEAWGGWGYVGAVVVTVLLVIVVIAVIRNRGN